MDIVAVHEAEGGTIPAGSWRRSAGPDAPPLPAPPRPARAGGIRPNRTHWNALLRAYAEAQRYDGCLAAYRRMSRRIPPDAYTLVALLRAAFHARIGVAAATWALELMETHAVGLTVELGTALVCCCRHFDAARDGEGAADAAGVAASVVGAMAAAGGRAAPNVRTYNSLMLVQAAAGEWGGVLETYEVVEAAAGLEANAVTWAVAVQACRATGQETRGAGLEELRATWGVLHGDDDA
jgi:pentatricopeptide repeat protein